MKILPAKLTAILAILLSLFATGICSAQVTNTITTPGGAFFFNVSGPGVDPSAQNPSITLTAGTANKFIFNTSIIHPVIISTNNFLPGVAYSGDSLQTASSSGSNIVTIPPGGFPATIYYMCDNHGFFGTITINAPVGPPPTSNTIVSIVVTTNIVMTSTGTNTTWIFVPQFNSNLVNGVWQDVPSYTNTFANGTNITVFDRLDAICGPNVFLRAKQTSGN